MKQHFIITKTKEVISRTYGGSNYELSIYENKGKNIPLKYVAEVKACTRGHAGEIHEAWQQLLKLDLIKPIILKAIKKDPYTKGSIPQYYSWQWIEKYGILLEII